MEFEQFKELLNEFVGDNFTTECKECHEQGHDIVPDDFKGSYDIAIKKLHKDLFDSGEAEEMKADLRTTYGDD